MEGFFDLPSSFNRPLNMLPDRLRYFVLVLLCYLYEGIKLAEMDPGLNRGLNSANPPLQLLLLCALQTFKMFGNSASHLIIRQGKGLVAVERVVL